MKAYRQDTVDSFSQWCSNNFLQLNVSKTNELVVDPRRGDHPIEPVKVNGQSVEEDEINVPITLSVFRFVTLVVCNKKKKNVS